MYYELYIDVYKRSEVAHRERNVIVVLVND